MALCEIIPTYYEGVGKESQVGRQGEPNGEVRRAKEDAKKSKGCTPSWGEFASLIYAYMRREQDINS